MSSSNGSVRTWIGSASAIALALGAVGAGVFVVPGVTGSSGCSGGTLTGGNTSGTALNIAPNVSSATAGNTICLNSGFYSFASTVSKSAMTTVKAASGVTKGQITFTSIDLQTSHNIRIQDFTATGEIGIGSDATPATNVQVSNFNANQGLCLLASTTVNHVLIDRGFFGDIGVACSGNGDGRLQIRGNDPNGNLFTHNAADDQDIQITNNTFEDTGVEVGSDGINTTAGVRGVVVGPGNYFLNIQENLGNCTAAQFHCDGVQNFAADRTTIKGNFFYDNSTGIADFDCDNMVAVTDNVIVGIETNHNVDLSGLNGTLVAHNTVTGPFGLNIYNNGGGCGNNVSVTVRDNVVSGLSVTSCTGCTQTNNVSTYTFQGGSAPTTWDDFTLLSPLNTATDGGNVGAHIGNCEPLNC